MKFWVFTHTCNHTEWMVGDRLVYFGTCRLHIGRPSKGRAGLHHEHLLACANLGFSKYLASIPQAQQACWKLQCQLVLARLQPAARLRVDEVKQVLDRLALQEAAADSAAVWEPEQCGGEGLWGTGRGLRRQGSRFLLHHLPLIVSL